METWPAVLVIFWLASGAHKEMVVEFADSCATFQMLQETNDVWVEDVGLPRQNPVSIECRCVALEDEIEGETDEAA